MSNLPLTAAGIVWYERGDYERIQEIMEDGDNLPTTYDDWFEKAMQSERYLSQQGIRTIRAVIKPDEFLEWCRARNLAVNAQGRNEFANWVAHELHSH